jgi:hypothetical protein
MLVENQPLEVDNLIICKSMAILEAPRRIWNTQCVKISVLANVKTFFKNVMTQYCTVPTDQR